MRTLNEILVDGIKDNEWTYCKAEYAPHEGCKVGMPEEFTPDGTTKQEVKTCYIVTMKTRDGAIGTYSEMMYLSDGKFYWYDNLWHDDETVDSELSDDWWNEPIAWIPYRNVADDKLPVAPCNADMVPTPTENEFLPK